MPAFGSGTHIPENQIPRFTYVLYLDRKSSEKSAPSGSNDSIYSRLLGSEYDKRSLSLSSQAEGEKKSQTALSSHIHKGILAPPSSSSKAAGGGGGGCGFPPHALSPLALERCQVRTHRETVEPPPTSAASAQRQQTAPAALLWGPLHTPQVPRTNQKLLQPPHPPKKLFIPFKLQTVIIV